MDCALRIRRSPLRSTPGVLVKTFPFEIEDAPDSVIFLPPKFSGVKLSNSDRDGPDPLETTEPPCASSPTHISCARLSTANILVNQDPSQHSILYEGGESNRPRYQEAISHAAGILRRNFFGGRELRLTCGKQGCRRSKQTIFGGRSKRSTWYVVRVRRWNCK